MEFTYATQVDYRRTTHWVQARKAHMLARSGIDVASTLLFYERQLKRLREVEMELSQYKQMYAELAHENHALKDLIEKKL